MRLARRLAASAVWFALLVVTIAGPAHVLERVFGWPAYLSALLWLGLTALVLVGYVWVTAPQDS